MIKCNKYDGVLYLGGEISVKYALGVKVTEAHCNL